MPDPYLPDVLPDRPFQNKLKDNCKNGIDLIVKILNALAPPAYPASFHPTGIEMLADKVAASVEEKKE